MLKVTEKMKHSPSEYPCCTHLCVRYKNTRSPLGNTSLLDNDIYENMGSPQPCKHEFGHHEVKDVGVSVSSLATTMQRLTWQEAPRAN